MWSEFSVEASSCSYISSCESMSTVSSESVSTVSGESTAKISTSRCGTIMCTTGISSAESSVCGVFSVSNYVR